MRAILVPVANRPECAAALRCAFSMAQRLSANVLGYHIRPHQLEKSSKRDKQAQRFELLPGLSDVVEMLVAPEHEIELKAKDAKALFEQVAKAHNMALRRNISSARDGGQAVWKEVLGSLHTQFPIIGPLADLIVVSRPKNESSRRAHAFMSAALMHSSRPVLLLPHRYKQSVGKRVLIAWNQSVEAAAIVHAAIPLLQTAESVSLVSAGPQHRLGPKTRAVQQYLKNWGIEARCFQTVGSHVTEELLETYRNNECDLLMMGAYSRAKWRETVFGGVTDYVLHKAKIPALVMHR